MQQEDINQNFNSDNSPQIQQENNNQLQNQQNVSLFAATLHPITSKYISQKMKSNQNQEEMDNADLRNLCENVKQELNQIEKSAAYDYLKVEREMSQLDQEIDQSDEILSELEDVLLNFRDHLNEIKSEMTSLQERSLNMNTSLTNRKQLQKLLGTFMDSAVLDPKLIDAINESPIDEQYVQYIKTLCQKLEYLKNSQLSDATAVKDLEPELNKLKNKACGRVRSFLLEKINLLKKPMTNVQIMQKSLLIRFRIFTEFLKEHYLEIYVELCKNYAEILSKFYLNSFKTYCREIEKSLAELYSKNDTLFNDNIQHIKQTVSSKNIQGLNQEQRSIYYLMKRDSIIQTGNQDTVQLNLGNSSQKSQKYLIEQIFRNINQKLIECVQGEVMFTSEFFNLSPEQNDQIFGGLFKQTFNYLFDFFKGLVGSSYDINGMLLIILVNEYNKNQYNDNRFTVLGYYFDHIGIIVWPRFEQIFESHLQSIRNSNIKLFKENEKKLGWQALYQRYVDFALSLYILYSHFDDNRMLCIRLAQLKTSIFEFIQRNSQEIPKDFDKITYQLRIYDQMFTYFNKCQLKQSKKEFQENIQKIEEETGKYIDDLIHIYMKDLFSNLIDFVRQYCKQEQAELNPDEQPKSQRSTDSEKISQPGKENAKLVENICQDLSYSWNKRTEAFKSECEKLFQGMDIQKKILKKFSTTFINYYGSFYKHLRANYPQYANQLSKVHEIMKEIQKSYNV